MAARKGFMLLSCEMKDFNKVVQIIWITYSSLYNTLHQSRACVETNTP